MDVEYIKYTDPSEIEKRSFEIIENALVSEEVLINGNTAVDIRMPNAITNVIKRCIHTTADFDYARTLCFSENAAEQFYRLIREGATVVTDTNMALCGINKRILSRFGCKSSCYMAEYDVIEEARRRNITRAAVSMERAMREPGPVIFVVGNAPTALITLKESLERGDYTPAFVIGVPVGFVNVVAAKEMIMDTDIPCIVNSGRKGGSTVAAAIVNALLLGMPD